MFRAPRDPQGVVWEGRDERASARRHGRRGKPKNPYARQARGRIPRQLLIGFVPDELLALLANPAIEVYHCHREKCAERLIKVDMYEISRMCRESEEDCFEV